jgi:hypothetical protein
MVIPFGAPEVAHLVDHCFEPVVHRDGNGYLKPETRWVFYPIRVRVWVNSHTHGFVNGHKSIPAGLWVQVCSYSTQTREPVDFLYPTKPSAYCHFIL